MISDIYKLSSVYVITSMTIVMYAHARCNGAPDVLNFSLKTQNLDGWTLSHLILNIVMGYFFPSFNCFVVAMILGTLWELIEYYSTIAKHMSLPLASLMDILFPLGTTQCKHYTKPHKDWTIYKLSDPFVNALGYGIGVAIAHQFR